jgi:activator of HSP90 ATPase
MPTTPLSRDYVPARRQIVTGAAAAICSVGMLPIPAIAEAGDGVSHTEESIHQEVVFKSDRKRVYEALIMTRQFDAVTQLSAAMQSAGMSKMQKATDISPHPGGAFALFGGYITGRQIELVPNELIVQAWRVGSWDRGIYSIARFGLTEEGAGTKIVFDHTGFPKGQAEHLAAGWRANYWDPLEKFLRR